MDVVGFRKLPIMGILRDVGTAVIEPVVKTIISSGLKTIEIAMNSSGAPELIRRVTALSGKRLMVGAGTVLNKDILESALDAGATFIVMPTLVMDVVEYCVKNNIPVFPGALTPQEIYNGWQAGATMVKVFPVKFFGPEYIREIKGPFKNIELLACGGVTPENMQSYFACGAHAVSFGASVFKREWLEKGDFESIGNTIKKYVQGFNAIRR